MYQKKGKYQKQDLNQRPMRKRVNIRKSMDKENDTTNEDKGPGLSSVR